LEDSELWDLNYVASKAHVSEMPGQFESEYIGYSSFPGILKGDGNPGHPGSLKRRTLDASLLKADPTTMSLHKSKTFRTVWDNLECSVG
jgi:hypothetical protein